MDEFELFLVALWRVDHDESWWMVADHLVGAMLYADRFGSVEHADACGYLAAIAAVHAGGTVSSHD